MRTNEARIAAMHMRAAEIDRTNRKRKVDIITGVSFAVCLIFVIGLAFKMPDLMGITLENTISEGMSASIFSGNGPISYIFVSIIAFLLGAAVTVFCYRIKKLNGLSDERDESENYRENTELRG